MFGRPDQMQTAVVSSRASGKKRSAPDEDFEMLDGEVGGHGVVREAPEAFNSESQAKIVENECQLTSIRELRHEIRKRKHNG